MQHFNKYLFFAKDFCVDFLSKPYSKLIVYSDQGGWSLDDDALALKKISTLLNIPAILNPKYCGNKRSIYYTSMFQLEHTETFSRKHRTAFDYYHGDPQKNAQFIPLFQSIKKNHQVINRIRVSQSRMKQVTLETGIHPSKVFQIPIGIDLDHFFKQTPQTKKSLREKLQIPQSALVIGSFQKDGQGWGEGLEPKLIKGPDIFLESLKILKDRIPELWVLLTGPARGYVKSGLEKIGIPYRHFFLKNSKDIIQYYHALDAYIISSREEGGPKALLESMASGIPVITTKVGQAMDLVEHGMNAWMVEQEDSSGLAFFTEKTLNDTKNTRQLIQNGYETAQQNSLIQQLPLWQKFFTGYVG